MYKKCTRRYDGKEEYRQSCCWRMWKSEIFKMNSTFCPFLISGPGLVLVLRGKYKAAKDVGGRTGRVQEIPRFWITSSALTLHFPVWFGGMMLWAERFHPSCSNAYARIVALMALNGQTNSLQIHATSWPWNEYLWLDITGGYGFGLRSFCNILSHKTNPSRCVTQQSLDLTLYYLSWWYAFRCKFNSAQQLIILLLASNERSLCCLVWPFCIRDHQVEKHTWDPFIHPPLHGLLNWRKASHPTTPSIHPPSYCCSAAARLFELWGTKCGSE